MVDGTRRIVHTYTVDNSTTGGKIVYVDNNGDTWEESYRTPENAGTGETIGFLKADGRIYL